MCLFDERLLARLTYRTAETTGDPVVGYPPPDLSRAYIFWAIRGGAAPQMVMNVNGAAGAQLPVDGTLALGGGSTRVYSRRSMGPLLRMPFFAEGDAMSATCVWHWYEIDHETYTTILNPEV